jgi:predicted nuclease of predicted toxin-antitoxin system
VKLLFDHNLSYRLVDRLAHLYPGSEHVRDLGLHSADDIVVWRYAIDHEFIIVSKDEDFHQMSFLHGAPPKVIWLKVGNCSTSQIEALLRERAELISEFSETDQGSFLVLSRDAI